MRKAIISDASCFILLDRIGALDILKNTYGRVTTTPVVQKEVRFPLPDWVEIRSAKSEETYNRLRSIVDPGEASAIALSLELTGSTLILDDLKARKVAKSLGLEVTGTIGVIVKAKNGGVIPSIRPYILSIRNTSFRLSQDVENLAFSLAGEVDE